MTTATYPEYFPSAARIVEMHDSGMKTYGGAEVYHVDVGCVDGALGATWTAGLYASNGEDPDPLHCAIHLFCYLNKKHCFTDGVKRVSWMTLSECLLLQGLKIDATQEEAIEFVKKHAGGEGLQIDFVAAWIVPRLIAAL